MGQRSLRRFSWILFGLVLLDQQHALRSDGDALLRWSFGLCFGPEPSDAGGQQSVRFADVHVAAGAAHVAKHRGTRCREVDQ